MYSKDQRIVEIEPIPDIEFSSICELNNVLFKKGFNILYSKERVAPLASPLCSDFCFMARETDQPDILTFIEDYPIPPSQEVRLGKTIDLDWINTNIYNPLLTSTSSVQIVGPFIGRELYEIVDVDPEKWMYESQWFFMLKEIFEIFKKNSIFNEKNYLIHTAIRINEEEQAAKTANKFRKFFLTDSSIDVKFIFYIYEKSFNPPDEFPHDRYVLTDHIGINIGIGLDTLNPDDQRIRRETQLTLVGNNTTLSILSQLKDLRDKNKGKKQRILRKRTI
ncbi:MAG: hypothetical protein ACFE9L_13090 [Candidatus Hodarchaeota archaeon]